MNPIYLTESNATAYATAAATASAALAAWRRADAAATAATARAAATAHASTAAAIAAATAATAATAAAAAWRRADDALAAWRTTTNHDEVTTMDLWNNDKPISEQFDEIYIPEWIDQNITPADVAAIVQGRNYMPAGTYFDALQTMASHGDDVLEYIQDQMGDLPNVPSTISWSGMAVHFHLVLSAAVELWASGVHDTLESKNEEEAA